MSMHDLDRSLAFTALLELSQDFRTVSGTDRLGGPIT